MTEDKPQYLATLRKGSLVTWWQPNGFAVGILEAHPEHPPRIIYFDGRIVDLNEAVAEAGRIEKDAFGTGAGE